ncbi:hydroxyethylthiazole kinase [Candidatus Methanomassiliicoccus intestinalis]|uniref:hydroxyethylthiazole kinase n=1 Tax=Candidatus Methanomassiliicoccus intestinalis TaxID=1406512 RepID=UPI0037DC05EE
MFLEIIQNVETKSPLINVITNFVTVNDCANILLAAGASPCMAYDIREVEDIVSICQGLVLNLGSIEDDRAMLLSTKRANELNIPVVFDPVAAGASKLRNELCSEFLQKVKFSVIRGNISEIKSIALGSATTKGVDANDIDMITEENIMEAIKLAKELSQKTGAVIAISGKIDIVADSQKAFVIRNGHPMMAKITGSGCMLTALIGAYCAANPDMILEATAAAVSVMGVCGEYAYQKTIDTDTGTSSFRNYLIDYIGKLSAEMIEEGMKVEIY